MLFRSQQGLICTSAEAFPQDRSDSSSKRAELKNRRNRRHKALANEIWLRAKPDLKRAIELSQERGASSIFSCIPLVKYRFAFTNKRDFTDLVRMRYRMDLRNLPRTCACGAKYSLDHSQVCRLGGFVHMRHDESKNLFASLARQVYKDVEVEPPLVPLSGEELNQGANLRDDARSDVKVRGFWSNQRDAFFEFRVSYPFAATYQNQKPRKLCTHLANTRKI